MKFLAAPFKQLLERPLWPVAVLLVAALAAVPAVLASDPDPAGPATGATASAGGLTEPIVSKADAARTDSEYSSKVGLGSGVAVTTGVTGVDGVVEPPVTPEPALAPPGVSLAAPEPSSMTSSFSSGTGLGLTEGR